MSRCFLPLLRVIRCFANNIIYLCEAIVTAISGKDHHCGLIRIYGDVDATSRSNNKSRIDLVMSYERNESELMYHNKCNCVGTTICRKDHLFAYNVKSEARARTCTHARIPSIQTHFEVSCQYT